MQYNAVFAGINTLHLKWHALFGIYTAYMQQNRDMSVLYSVVCSQ